MYSHDDDSTPIKGRQCKSHGVTKCDADPENLFRVCCSRCDYVRDFDPSGTGAAKYLYYRRRTRAARGLLSVGAPLDGPSAAYLCRAAAECGIVSNTTQPHVTFVEGLVPDVDHTAAIGRLRSALFADPKLTVISVHRVPRRDNATDLILADVIFSPGADAAASELSDGQVCHLPQFPFHVALGACPKARGGSKRAAAWAEARLKGVALAFDATRVRVLPPPEGTKKLVMGKQQSHQLTDARTPPRSLKTRSQGHFNSQQHKQAQYPGQGNQQAQYQWHHHQQYCLASQQQHHFQQPQPQWGSPLPEMHFFSSPQMSNADTDQGSSFDDTDALSSSGSSATSVDEAKDAHFPGLAVDLTFLDDGDHTKSATVYPQQQSVMTINTYVPTMPTSIWARA